MIAWSLLAGLLGILTTGAVVAYVGSRRPGEHPDRYGYLGLVAPVPAWLVALAGLLDQHGTDSPTEVYVLASSILSAVVALLALLLTDLAARRLLDSGRPPRVVSDWLLGVAAFAPAWGIALLGLAWIQR